MVITIIMVTIKWVYMVWCVACVCMTVCIVSKLSVSIWFSLHIHYILPVK